MKKAFFVSIVIGAIVFGFLCFRWFSYGELELLTLLVAGLVVLVGLIGLRVEAALNRIAELSSAITSQPQSTMKLSEQLREDGVLSATAEQATDDEIDAILE